MSCPTCGHTMQSLSTGERHYWCPRCGTIKEVGTHSDDLDVPKLVERCRTFAETLPSAGQEYWHRVGIRESINLPDSYQRASQIRNHIDGLVRHAEQRKAAGVECGATWQEIDRLKRELLAMEAT